MIENENMIKNAAADPNPVSIRPRSVKRIFKWSLIALLILCAAFGSGYFTHSIVEKKNARVEVYKDNSAFLLPTEVEKRIVTIDEIHSELMEISEFSTYSAKYTVHKAVDSTRYLFASDDGRKGGFAIPGTKNSIALTCDGIVKVGYDFNEIDIRVDNESRKIYIALPDAKVNDNYIIWDTVICEEKNTILNPIEFEQYQQLISEIEEEGLTDAESRNIYESAEQAVRKIINAALAGFDGFEVVYM